MKAVIIDDELHCREVLQNHIETYCPEIKCVEKATDVEEGIAKIQNFQPQIVFLDIQLEDRLSFEILNALAEINFKIIFTTAYDNYAIKAFDYAAVHYLLKPITPDDFTEAVNRCLAELGTNDEGKVRKAESFYVKTTASGHQILFEEVAYIQADGSYSTIFYLDGRDLFTSKTLGEYQHILPHYFFRIHNSILVNLKAVRTLNDKENTTCLVNGNIIPVSRRKKKGFKAALSEQPNA